MIQWRTPKEAERQLLLITLTMLSVRIKIFRLSSVSKFLSAFNRHRAWVFRLCRLSTCKGDLIMATATRATLSASTLIGDAVKNRQGESLGEIKEIMLDLISGR